MKKLLMLLLLIPALASAECVNGVCGLKAKRQVVQTPAADQAQAECNCNKKRCNKCNKRKRAATRKARACARCTR